MKGPRKATRVLLPSSINAFNTFSPPISRIYDPHLLAFLSPAVPCEPATHLDEGLDLTPPLNLLRAHALCDLERVALNASHNGMRVWALLGSLVELLDYDDLLAGMATLENDRDL
jgi:hypothetical protein